MPIGKILEKQEKLKLRAIRNYCMLNQNIFGKIKVKPLLKFIEGLYRNEK
jgi:hypothetical protein